MTRLVLLVSLALLPSACGGDSNAERPASPTTAAETSTVVPLPMVDEPPPPAGSLIGTWSRIGVAGLVRFNEEGGFRIARNTEDLLDSPYAVGTYRHDGATVELTGGCRTVWRVGLAGDDDLHAVVVEEGCGISRGTVLTLARISVP